MPDPEPLIPKYGAYRKLKSYRMARLVHDVTATFCTSFIEEHSEAYEQMVESAERAAFKIAEGSQAGAHSKKAELKLTNAARASLEELRRHYERFLRQQELLLWAEEDTRRAELIARRPRHLDDVLQWAEEQEEPHGHGQRTIDTPIRSMESTPSIHGLPHLNPETLANGAVSLIAIACALLDRQISAQQKVVDYEANLAERLRRRRMADWPD